MRGMQACKGLLRRSLNKGTNMAKTYKGSLSLEWYNKQKSILLKSEDSTDSSKDIPAPVMNWVNKDEALYYEIVDEEGRGLKPYWVDRNDIRVKEARPIVFQSAFKAIKKDKNGTIPGTDTYFEVEESKVDDPSINNILIKGDNLISLNTLKKHFDNQPESEKVKCIYIDPPFNTDVAFEHYDDSLEHSEWLTMMRDRLFILHGILRNDGLMFIHLDDVEVHYLKVLCDEIFGRANFVSTISVRSSTPSGVKTAHKNKTIIKQKDLILVYKKSESAIFFPQYIRKETWDTHFNYYLDKDNKTVSPLIDVLIEKRILNKEDSISSFDIENPNHRDFYLSNAEFICQTQSHKDEELKEKSLKNKNKVIVINEGQENEIMFYNGRQLTPLSKSLNPIYYNKEKIKDFSMLLCDFWSDIDFQNTQNEGGVSFPNSKKPEELMLRIFELSTKEGDLVLDCFAGSGTTLAVAHKMKRRWIGIEIGKHADTHIIERLKNILIGKDQTGVTPETNWQGGGSFKYYHLGPSIIRQNEDGTGDFNWLLGRTFIEESLLLSYDYVLDTGINLQAGQLFQNKEAHPTIGIQKIGTKNRVAIVSLNEPDGKLGIMPYEEITAIYKVIKQRLSPEYINIFTNRGIDIAYDSKPDDLEIIKVPHAIFAELEK